MAPVIVLANTHIDASEILCSCRACKHGQTSFTALSHRACKHERRSESHSTLAPCLQGIGRGWAERSDEESAVAVATVPHLHCRSAYLVFSASCSDTADSDNCMSHRDEWLPARLTVADFNDAGC
jgi:hypothetical protein